MKTIPTEARVVFLDKWMEDLRRLATISSTTTQMTRAIESMSKLFDEIYDLGYSAGYKEGERDGKSHIIKCN